MTAPKTWDILYNIMKIIDVPRISHELLARKARVSHNLLLANKLGSGVNCKFSEKTAKLRKNKTVLTLK
jgi:hypothetical protein